MEKTSQEYTLNIILNNSIDREELLIKKYNEYDSVIKDNEQKGIIKEFKKNSQEHIKMLKDKMNKLNISLG